MRNGFEYTPEVSPERSPSKTPAEKAHLKSELPKQIHVAITDKNNFFHKVNGQIKEKGQLRA